MLITVGGRYKIKDRRWRKKKSGVGRAGARYGEANGEKGVASEIEGSGTRWWRGEDRRRRSGDVKGRGENT